MGKENGVMFQYFEWYLPADASLWKTVSANAQELSDKGFLIPMGCGTGDYEFDAAGE